jgi:hypothetical protein
MDVTDYRFEIQIQILPARSRSQATTAAGATHFRHPVYHIIPYIHRSIPLYHNLSAQHPTRFLPRLSTLVSELN